jgi:hypothetical protein
MVIITIIMLKNYSPDSWSLKETPCRRELEEKSEEASINALNNANIISSINSQSLNCTLQDL